MMKSLFKSLVVLATLAWVGGASASPLASLNPSPSAGFSHDVSGTVTDIWTINLVSDATVGIIATNQYLTMGSSTIGKIDGFAGEISGPGGSQGLTLSTAGNTQTLSFLGALAAGSYSLMFTGNAGAGASYSGSVVAAPSAVPVPAALWLLGSALVGLVGIGRRSAAA